jgi:hypothetical protein
MLRQARVREVVSASSTPIITLADSSAQQMHPGAVEMMKEDELRVGPELLGLCAPIASLVEVYLDLFESCLLKALFGLVNGMEC